MLMQVQPTFGPVDFGLFGLVVIFPVVLTSLMMLRTYRGAAPSQRMAFFGTLAGVAWMLSLSADQTPGVPTGWPVLIAAGIAVVLWLASAVLAGHWRRWIDLAMVAGAGLAFGAGYLYGTA